MSSDNIDSYVITPGLLGRGGFGAVYRGVHKLTGQDFAIKFIRKSDLKTKSMVERVRKEAEIHSQLKHPNVLELYNCIEDHDYVYLILELCENADLFSYVKKNSGGLPEPDARRLFNQVLDGLRYLHTHGIMHRDINANNILLTKNFVAKIADFGLATKHPGNDPMKTICGTPNAMAPEVISREGYSYQAEVWSLGILLYTMIMGFPPFDGITIKNTLRNIRSNELHISSHVSKPLRNLLERMLSKSIHQRPTIDDIVNHEWVQGNSSSSFVGSIFNDDFVKENDSDSRKFTQQNHPSRNFTSSCTKDSGFIGGTTITNSDGTLRYSASPSVEATARNIGSNKYFKNYLHQTESSTSRPPLSSLVNSDLSLHPSNKQQPYYPVVTQVLSSIMSNNSSAINNSYHHSGVYDIINKNVTSTASQISNNGCIISSSSSRHKSNIVDDVNSLSCSCIISNNSSTHHSCKNKSHNKRRLRRPRPASCSRVSSSTKPTTTEGGYCNKLTDHHHRHLNDRTVNTNSSVINSVTSKYDDHDHSRSRSIDSHRRRSSHSSHRQRNSYINDTGDNDECLLKRKTDHESAVNHLLREKNMTNESIIIDDQVRQDCQNYNNVDNDEMKKIIIQNKEHQNSPVNLSEFHRDQIPSMISSMYGGGGNCTISSSYFRAISQQMSGSYLNNKLSPPKPSSDSRSNPDSNQQNLKPFSTIRLRPLRQKLKDAVVHILSDGRIFAEFYRHKNSTDQLLQMIMVSSDGESIHVNTPKNSILIAHDTEPMYDTSTPNWRHYNLESLPERFCRKYLYLSRFVNLVKSKTPKVTVYYDDAKAMLMEDTARFEVEFDPPKSWKFSRFMDVAKQNVRDTSHDIMPSIVISHCFANVSIDAEYCSDSNSWRLPTSDKNNSLKGSLNKIISHSTDDSWMNSLPTEQKMEILYQKLESYLNIGLKLDLHCIRLECILTAFAEESPTNIEVCDTVDQKVSKQVFPVIIGRRKLLMSNVQIGSHSKTDASVKDSVNSNNKQLLRSSVNNTNVSTSNGTPHSPFQNITQNMLNKENIQPVTTISNNVSTPSSLITSSVSSVPNILPSTQSAHAYSSQTTSKIHSQKSPARTSRNSTASLFATTANNYLDPDSVFMRNIGWVSKPKAGILSVMCETGHRVKVQTTGFELSLPHSDESKIYPKLSQLPAKVQTVLRELFRNLNVSSPVPLN